MAETSLLDDENAFYPYWRRIWQITSGILSNTTEDEVRKTLFAHQEEIVKGVLLFKSNALIDTEKLKSKLQQSTEVTDFLVRASDILFVNADVGWLVLKSYIVNDYCGSIKSIQKLQYEMEIIPMLKSIWRFFSSERMFLLKTLKHIIEYKEDKKHAFAKIYEEFVNTSKQSIWKSLMAQFSYLIHEMKAETAKIHENEWMKFWIQRNSQEITEVLHCMIMCTGEETLEIGHFYDLLVLCKKHGFGTEPLFRGGVCVADNKSIKNITISEGALLLCVANQLWSKMDSTWYENSNHDKLRAEIDALTYRSIDGAVCYIWAMLHLSLPNKKIAIQNNYESLGMKAAQLNCYQFFNEMVRSPMFEEAKCLIGASVQDAIINMFTIAFENIIAHPMFEVKPIAETMNHILRSSFICDKFFNLSERIGVVPLWSTIIEQYPQNILAFCQLSEGIILSESQHTQEVIDLLGNLSYFTEEYFPADLIHSNRLTGLDDLELVRLIEAKYCSFGRIRFEIPENTSAVITREATYSLIHYKYPTSFWNMIPAELSRVMYLSEGELEGEMPLVLTYLRVVLAALKVDKCYEKRMGSFSKIYQILFSLMERMAEDFRNPSLNFFAICFDIFTEALQYHRTYIQTQIEIYKLLPVIRKTVFEFNQIFSIDFMEHGKLGKLLIRNEYSHYDVLLISYLKFLRTALLLNDGDIRELEMPGVVFILKEIYPYLISWFNKSNRKSGIYIDVIYEIVQFLFEIFGGRADDVTASHTQLHQIVYRFFVNELCGREWLRMLYVANSQIQTIMEEETNWHSGRGIKYISAIQKVMSILVRLLAEKATMVGEEEKTPLEHVMYYESDGIHAIQAIASFVNHPFNESIPILAVRLLKKFTTELQMSMLAALNLEPDQVRMLFVQRLRDHLEDDQLKLAIIEFITSCIPKQSGMTEAFFKVSDRTKFPLILIRRDSTSDENSSELGSSAFNEGIGAFLVEYLYTFNNISCPINTAILSRIMKVFHTLWLNQKEILITDITKDADFWPSICSAIFKEFCLEDKTYAEIFNIIAKEIHKKRGAIDDNLKEVLKTFFSWNNEYFDNWMRYCFLGESRYPESMLILAVKDFLIIGTSFIPAFFQDPNFKLKILEYCRMGLKFHILHMDNTCNMAFVGELYTFLLKTWEDVAFKCDEHALYRDTVTIMCNIKPFYSKLPGRFLEVVLAMVMRSVRGLKPTVATSDLTIPLIECIGSIVMLEYQQFVEKMHSKSNSVQNINDFQLRVAFNVLNELVAVYSSNQYAKSIDFFFEVQFLEVLYDCVKMFISRPNALELAKLAVESLIVYIHSPNSNDFLLSEIQYKLWEITVAPVRCRHPGYLETSGVISYQILEWWMFYRKMMIFLTLLLRKHEHMIIRQIIMFVSLHEEYLVEILLLERYTVNDKALELIKHTLIFVKEVLNYKLVWSIEHEQSLKAILDAVKMSLNYSSSVIVRPAVLKFASHLFEDLGGMETERVDLLVETIEHLTDIICLATSCFLKFSPPLFKKLGDVTDYSTWPLQVGTSFGVPNFSANHTCELTFGMLFCVSSVYVRILQQIPGPHKKINTILSPREILVARKGRVSVSKSDEKSNLTKSSSVSTVDADSNLTTSSTTDSIIMVDKDSSQFNFNPVKRLEASKRSFEIIRIDCLSPMCVISAVENFSTYANPAKTVPWYSRLSEEKAMRALELVMTLIGSQVSQIIYQQSLANRECRLIKRELSSELQSFHELVRRRVAESHRYSTSERSNLFRKKFGIIEPEAVAEKPSVEVIRAIPSKRSLDMRTSTSSITVTPVSSKSSISTERTTLPTSTNGLFEVRLVNDDYLHFLSVWFSNFLHYEENCLQ